MFVVFCHVSLLWKAPTSSASPINTATITTSCGTEGRNNGGHRELDVPLPAPKEHHTTATNNKKGGLLLADNHLCDDPIMTTNATNTNNRASDFSSFSMPMADVMIDGGATDKTNNKKQQDTLLDLSTLSEAAIVANLRSQVKKMFRKICFVKWGKQGSMLPVLVLSPFDVDHNLREKWIKNYGKYLSRQGKSMMKHLILWYGCENPKQLYGWASNLMSYEDAEQKGFTMCPEIETKSSDGQVLSQVETQTLKRLWEARAAKKLRYHERFTRCSSIKIENDEELLFYQIACVNFLQRNLLQNQGSILSDQMGAGISVVLSFLSEFPKAGTPGPFLVVASEKSLQQWMAEAMDYSNSLNIIEYGKGIVNTRDIQDNLEQGLRKGGKSCLVITTVDIALKDITFFSKIW